ncbi:MAG: NADH-quinone oxidoreductase subunit K [Polyangiaceae bacterium]
MSPELLTAYVVTIVLLATTGLFYLLVTTNLIRALVALELMTKAVTLGLVLVGKLTNNPGFTQALTITVIVIEVVILVVAVGLVLLCHKHTGTVDARNLRNIRG